jgi:hypothetical protein
MHYGALKLARPGNAGNLFLPCKWLQVAANICNYLQVSVWGLACVRQPLRGGSGGRLLVGITSRFLIGAQSALVILHTSYSSIS